MTTFTGTANANTVHYLPGIIVGFSGGSIAELQDAVGDIYICDPENVGSNDWVFAGPGNDLIQGGWGDDILYGGNGDDTIYSGTQANPERSAGADILNGEFGNDTLIGGTGGDTLIGEEGNDILNGGSGADYMVGGVGNDTYYVDQPTGEVFENPNEGTDLVYAGLNYTLTAEVENLVLTGANELTGTGNSLGNWLSGNNSANKLFGLGGSDVLQGLGGADQLFGGDGNDSLYADSLLFDFDTTQNLLHGENGNDTLTGASGADILRGGAGNDHLIGLGGADRLIGGTGNDTYDIDPTDQIVEAAGEGIDTINAFLSYRLTANVEHLNVAGLIGDFFGTGNELNNTITGNLGANLLKGLDGNDTLFGRTGNDTLIGGAGNDRLSGQEGLDVLNGGGGKDTFVFDTALNSITNVDAIQGFVSGVDKIAIDNAIFTGLANGPLPAGAFRLGAAADANDRIIYNNITGALFFDGDGSGPAGLVQFATLTGAPLLQASDFLVI